MGGELIFQQHWIAALSISFVCINVEGVNLKNTIHLQLVQQPITLTGLLLFHTQMVFFKEYVVQFQEKKFKQ